MMAEQNFPDRALYNLDNLDVLRGMNSETVDLIATDPPFNKKRNRSASSGQYEDAWRWADHPTMQRERPEQWKWQPVHRIWLDQIRDENEALFRVIEATRLTQDDDTAAFLCFLGVRLLEMRRVLKPTGSIYLHCDDTASNYIRMTMDAIFGKTNLRNEIVWLRRQDRHNLATRHMGRAHDTILWYVKSNDAEYNIQYTPYSDQYIRTAYKYSDRRGQYRTLPCTNETGGNKPYDFKGITRAWRFAPERMEQMYQDDMLVQAKPTSPFQYKKYLNLEEGVKIQDVWTDIPGSRGNESTSSPDQKPVALYERIIKASSNPGDLVLDPFCGCATTPIAAHNLGRRWVGIDRREDAAFHIANRLLGLGINVNEFKVQQQALLDELQAHCEILSIPPFVPTKTATLPTCRRSICGASRPRCGGRICWTSWCRNGGCAAGAAALNHQRWSTLTLTTCCRRRKAAATNSTIGPRYAAPATGANPTR